MCQLPGISASAPLNLHFSWKRFALWGSDVFDNPDGWGGAYLDEPDA